MQYYRILIFCLSLVFLQNCKEKKKYHDKEPDRLKNIEIASIKKIVAYQSKLNAEFKDPEISPLLDKHRKNFESLDFFEPDTTYIVQANFTRTPNAVPFLMPTTTDRKSKEVVYGTVAFKIHGIAYQLELYQNEELILEEGYEDYLFFPFTDETNGEETYGGGRYIDLRIPKSNRIEIDFNRAYNPYCAYNKKYSCPIVPSVNTLNTKVLAGVKAFVATEE